MSKKWEYMESRDVYVHWWGGWATGVFSRGLYDTQPLDSLLRHVYLDRGGEMHRRLSFSCVDANTGRIVMFNESYHDLPKAVKASSSMPTLFPSVNFRDENVSCIDGGVIWNTNLVSAVERCREMVDHDWQITLDVINCDGRDLEAWTDRSAIGNWFRYREIQSYKQGQADIDKFIRAFPKVSFRHYVEPTKPMPSGWGVLDFDNSTITWPC